MSTSEDIEAFCTERCISRLCHFTRSSKLGHILSDSGIESHATLAGEQCDIFDPTDPNRFDRLEQYVNCSIEYPNSWMLLNKMKEEKVFDDWAVLLINPSYIWRPGTIFSTVNAASGAALKGVGLSALEALFASTIQERHRQRHRPPNMLKCCPTNGQAEALIPGTIQREDILAVAVRDEAQARRELLKFKYLPGARQVDFVIAPAFFEATWYYTVSEGRRPVETILGHVGP